MGNGQNKSEDAPHQEVPVPPRRRPHRHKKHKRPHHSRQPTQTEVVKTPTGDESVHNTDDLKVVKFATAANHLFTARVGRVTSDTGLAPHHALSPFNLMSTIGILQLGAGGTTLAELNDITSKATSQELWRQQVALHHTLSKTGSVKTSYHLILRPDIRRGLLPEYEKAVSQLAKIWTADIKTDSDSKKLAGAINKLVDRNTEGMIKHVANGRMFDRDTCIVILGTLYFRGFWKEAFDPQHTDKKTKFYIPGGAVQYPPMMQQTDKRFWYGETKQYQLLELPYKTDFVMQLALPWSKDAVPTYSADPKEWATLWSANCTETKLARVTLPQFRLDGKYYAQSWFEQDLRCKTLCSNADFSHMVDAKTLASVRPIYVSSIIHNVVIEVDEEGTKAAAATVVVLKSRSARTPVTKNFIANHPFMVVIRHKKSNVVLFMGVYIHNLVSV